MRRVPRPHGLTEPLTELFMMERQRSRQFDGELLIQGAIALEQPPLQQAERQRARPLHGFHAFGHGLRHAVGPQAGIPKEADEFRQVVFERLATLGLSLIHI